MSALVRCKSKMTDKAYLISALKQLAVPDTAIKDSFTGDTSRIGIAKSWHNGTWGQAEYVKGPQSKTYTLTASTEANRALDNKVGGSFNNQVQQWYAALKVQDTLTAQGLYPTVQKEQGRIKVIAYG